MLEKLFGQLAGFRVANFPVGEGVNLTISMMLSQITMALGKNILGKMGVPEMSCKLLGNGATIVGLPMLIRATKMGDDSVADRIAIAATALSINDVMNIQKIISNILKAIPGLSGAEELGAGEQEEYVEVPYTEVAGAEELGAVEELYLPDEEVFAGVQEEDELANILALQT